ncbi:arsenate reductase/protein-tyrosine-phosphatase family protein [Microbacterium rhizophilus]|uniref:arsenate reductase/protein-tyrosine-phosphatase family protein n=1 Tax=Microbacterium rhizophilus TaxID=3138934 RepID=UPI0031EA9B74
MPQQTGRSPRETAPVRVLYVCTANRCRSPFAEQILRRAAGSLPLSVASAGVLEGGHPTPRNGVAVARERGLDLAGHRSASLSAIDVDGFDLILTMERGLSRELVAAHPGMRARVFTVRQFDRRRDGLPVPPALPLGPWLDEAASGDARVRLFGPDEDDTPDPLTGPKRAWRRLADELEPHAEALVAWLYAGGAAGEPIPRSSAS